jgi:hypothetical protein
VGISSGYIKVVKCDCMLVLLSGQIFLILLSLTPHHPMGADVSANNTPPPRAGVPLRPT